MFVYVFVFVFCFFGGFFSSFLSFVRLPPGTSPNAGGCAPTDLMRLHVFNLTDYDAVIYYDGDVQIVGNIMPVFQCAASGEFMMTEGAGAMLNAGFMALQPKKSMLDLAMWFAANSKFTRNMSDINVFKGGWDNGSARPSHYGTWAGFECGQGFLWTLLYGNGMGWRNATSKNAKKAFEMFPDAFPFPPRIVNRCVYNYQHEIVDSKGRPCTDGSYKNCSSIVALHKQWEPKEYKNMMEKPESFGVCKKFKHDFGLPPLSPNDPQLDWDQHSPGTPYPN